MLGLNDQSGLSASAKDETLFRRMSKRNGCLSSTTVLAKHAKLASDSLLASDSVLASHDSSHDSSLRSRLRSPASVDVHVLCIACTGNIQDSFDVWFCAIENHN